MTRYSSKRVQKKMLAILTSMGALEVLRDDIERCHNFFLFEKDARLIENQIKNRIVQVKSKALNNQQFDIRSSRREWRITRRFF